MLNNLRYSTSRMLRKIANRVYPKTKGIPSSIIANIGEKELDKNAKHALLIYTISAVRNWIEGTLDKFDLNKHTIYWESVEMVKQLNVHGYIVDFADGRSKPQVDYSKYDLIIDNWNNLKDCPINDKQTKIHWTTYPHWLTYNLAELNRMQMFHARTGIHVPMNRQLPTILSDEYADYLTYFGTDLQLADMDRKAKRFQINISSAHIPKYVKKDISIARNKFLWIGGGGLILKGLDIVLEAFSQMPEAELYIVGNPPEEPRFWKWAKPIVETSPNIHLMGWMDLTSDEYNEMADKCIATVYASAGEGGPGAIARAIHNGLIPIVTPESLVRAEVFGYIIEGKTDNDIVKSTIDRVKEVMALPNEVLMQKSDAVRGFAKKYHTRQAFTQSFIELIKDIESK